MTTSSPAFGDATPGVFTHCGGIGAIPWSSSVLGSRHLRFRHRYEVDPQYIAQLEEHGLVFSGKAPQHPIMQVLELPPSVHPYFLGTQAHPELTSRPLRPQPMFLGLIKAAIDYAAHPLAHASGSILPQTV